jgi:Histidine kinase
VSTGVDDAVMVFRFPPRTGDDVDQPVAEACRRKHQDRWRRRRLLQRQLHDGAALRISALTLRLGLLEHRAAPNGQAVQDSIGELQDELHTVLEELRDVASLPQIEVNVRGDGGEAVPEQLLPPHRAGAQVVQAFLGEPGRGPRLGRAPGPHQSGSPGLQHLGKLIQREQHVIGDRAKADPFGVSGDSLEDLEHLCDTGHPGELIVAGTPALRAQRRRHGHGFDADPGLVQ